MTVGYKCSRIKKGEMDEMEGDNKPQKALSWSKTAPSMPRC